MKRRLVMCTMDLPGQDERVQPGYCLFHRLAWGNPAFPSVHRAGIYTTRFPAWGNPAFSAVHRAGTYSTKIFFLAHISRRTFGQTVTLTSPRWAFLRSAM